jgi:hypothetical protein
VSWVSSGRIIGNEENKCDQRENSVEYSALVCSMTYVRYAGSMAVRYAILSNENSVRTGNGSTR